MAAFTATGGNTEAHTARRGPFGRPRVFHGAGGPVPLTHGSTYAGATSVYASGYSGTSAYVPPYSYYAAIPPAPARIYVGYGGAGFPFYGRRYGSPNDRWRWEALGHVPYGGILNRYDVPPVR